MIKQLMIRTTCWNPDKPMMTTRCGSSWQQADFCRILTSWFFNTCFCLRLKNACYDGTGGLKCGGEKRHVVKALNPEFTSEAVLWWMHWNLWNFSLICDELQNEIRHFPNYMHHQEKQKFCYRFIRLHHVVFIEFLMFHIVLITYSA